MQPIEYFLIFIGIVILIILAIVCLKQRQKTFVGRGDDKLSNYDQKNKTLTYMNGKLYRYNTIDDEVLTMDTPFHIGSLTKLFTAATLRILEDSGKINLNDGWKKYSAIDVKGFPDCPIMDIIDHKAKLIRYPPRSPVILYDKYTTAGKIVDSWKDSGVVYDANINGVSYSNVGYQLLGHIIENVYGADWFTAMSELIFKPLNMRANTNLIKNIYVYTDGIYHTPQPYELNEFYYAASSGGLCMSMNDLLKFGKNITKLIPDIVERPIYRIGKNINHNGSLPEARCHAYLTTGGANSDILRFVYIQQGIIEDRNPKDSALEFILKTNKELCL